MASPRNAALLLLLSTIAFAAMVTAHAEVHRKQLDEDEQPSALRRALLGWGSNNWSWGWNNEKMEGGDEEMPMHDSWGEPG